MKKLVSSALGLVLCCSLVACGNNTGGVDASAKKAIADSAKKLESTYTDYIIANTLEAPDGTTQYIEVVHEDDCYTEFSVDKDGNLGTLGYGESESMTYALNDWLTSTGDYYIFAVDNEGNDVIYKLPESYTNYVEDRPYLYINDLLDGAKSIEKQESFETDLGLGKETFTSYKIVVDSKVVKEVLGVSSYGIYDSVRKDEKDSNIAQLCEYYLEDINMNLVFSDANVIVGIDNNGILRYMCLETGGLGSRLYFTKAVVSVSNENIRTTPDFSESVKYSSALQDLADFVANYESYDKALEALNNNQNQIIESTGGSSESTEVVDDTEIIETEEE